MSETPKLPPPDRTTKVVRGVIIGIGVALATLATYAVTRPAPVPNITARVTASDVVDDERIIVTIEVDKPPLASALCEIAAFDADDKSVGRLTNVPIGPDHANRRRTTKTVDVPTSDRAVAARVAQCAITRGR